MSMTDQKLFSLLGGANPVTLVANDKLEGNPLITPIVDDRGLPKVDSKGRELGSIRLEQNVSTLSSGSFLNSSRRVTFIGGAIIELQDRVLAGKWIAGSQFPGKLLLTEQLKPFFKNQGPKINPQSGEIVSYTIDGKQYPVYAQTTYTQNPDAEDITVRSIEAALESLSKVGGPVEEVINAPSHLIETAGVPA